MMVMIMNFKHNIFGKVGLETRNNVPSRGLVCVCGFSPFAWLTAEFFTSLVIAVSVSG